ncbi:MAG: ribonuclease [Firmicutes bacterium]|nr:ribonuclease [Bacillota bacterium]
MKEIFRKLGLLALLVMLLSAFTACGGTDDFSSTTVISGLEYNGSYTTAEDVSAYLREYGQLPGNFITKSQARDLGWEGGGLEEYAPGCCIGGDKFGNYEGLLPEESGRRYYECDINTLGKDSRGAERLVYSNDGLIYYTPDHYESFELLYGDD